MGEKKIIIDSNVLVGLFFPEDAFHEKAKKLILAAKKQSSSFLALNLVIQESATVLSFKKNMEKARLFVDRYGEIIDTVIMVERVLEERAWKVFLGQTKRGTSFVDCANLVAIQFYNLDGILSFDRFYPKELRPFMV